MAMAVLSSTAPNRSHQPHTVVANWHTLASDEVAHALDTGPNGITLAEADLRLRRYGPNELAEEKEERWWSAAARQVRDPLLYILFAAAATTIVLRDVADTIVILLVVALNGAIGFIQERKATRMMRALSRLSAPRAQVVRDGHVREIPARELVRGDVVTLTSGSRVPADVRITIAQGLVIDESLLTGESEPVDKTTVPLAPAEIVVSDQRNMAFAGTTVTQGRGRGIVVRTGATTELGNIATVVRALGRTATPLQESFTRFGRIVGLTIVGLAIVLVIVGVIRGLPPADIFLTAVAMAVSAVPEGLPVVLTITLAVGVRRMAKRRAIIRSLPAVETLGSTTVIGSDKTGTLTKNEMTVRSIWTADAEYDVTGVGYALAGTVRRSDQNATAVDERALRATLEAGVLASEVDAEAGLRGATSGDPVEMALLIVATKGGIDPVEMARNRPEVDAIPFESERRLMISLRRGQEGLTVYMKGAPEAVLARCDDELRRDGTRPIDRERALAAAGKLASKGLRVLALAYRASPARSLDDEGLTSGFTLTGLVGMEDPLRPEAIDAVTGARRAGVRVLMLTGDHVETARTIGVRLGLGERALSGEDLGLLSDAELDTALSGVSVYARVAPEHKLRIVQRLKATGEVVAITGDGVNDAPALRAAHLGIAMGAGGSDVARDAADMVLADDNFATITAAIEEGRLAFANIRKVTFFLLSSATGEIIAIATAVLAGWPLPFTAAQILWINLVTDSLQAMALAFERSEPGLLARPPRPRNEGVLARGHVLRLGLVGALLATATLVVFAIVLEKTGDVQRARSMALTEMVVLQLLHLFNCRSLDQSIFRISPLANRLLFVSLLATAAAHVAALYTPVLRQLLKTVAPTLSEWALILAVSVVVIVGGELDKLVNRVTGRRLA